jgi:hypothetical protein
MRAGALQRLQHRGAATAAAGHDGGDRQPRPAALMPKRSDWSRPLPQPLQLLDGDKPILTLATVADARELIVKRLPEESRQKSTWRYVAGLRRGPVDCTAHGAFVGGHRAPAAIAMFDVDLLPAEHAAGIKPDPLSA